MNTLKKNPYLFATATALAIIAAFIFVSEPQKTAINEQFNEVGRLTADRELAQQQVDQSTRFQADFQSLIDQEANLNTYLFPRGQELQFFQTLEDRAAATKVELAVQFKQLGGQTDTNVIPTSLSVSGSWPNIISFLNELERLPQYLTVTTINIQAGDRTSGAIELNSYWYEPQEH